MTQVEIISFGYLHGPPPTAHITLDLRHHFRDPHVSPELRHMTANDAAVQDAVYATLGITALINAISASIAAFAAGPTAGPITVAIGCAGGRHRAPAVAQALGSLLAVNRRPRAVHHRDLHQPVINR
ncbi:ATPase [Streptomyces sp. NPDC060322]|uniref:RapZ C-terminal domain-containing protein n=1 Tax=Streptomyces sp. NPDC060322 TaxID=3347097 RepID=UPI003668884F